MRDRLEKEATESKRSMNTGSFIDWTVLRFRRFARGNEGQRETSIMDKILQTAAQLERLVQEKKDTDAFSELNNLAL